MSSFGPSLTTYRLSLQSYATLCRKHELKIRKFAKLEVLHICPINLPHDLHLPSNLNIAPEVIGCLFGKPLCASCYKQLCKFFITMFILSIFKFQKQHPSTSGAIFKLGAFRNGSFYWTRLYCTAWAPYLKTQVAYFWHRIPQQQ